MPNTSTLPFANSSAMSSSAPVTDIGDAPAPLSPKPALCLSGGGYRAMLFHLGSLWRLNELGWLPKLDRISSVSGGSIANARLGLAWPSLTFVGGVATNFVKEVAAPIQKLAGKTIDEGSILGGILFPGSTISEKVIAAYQKHLFGKASLRSLPAPAEGTPRFVFNASSVQSGALVRFSRDYVADYRVGRITDPDALAKVSLAEAVAASSAFPPFLSPMILDVDPSHFQPLAGADLQELPYTTEMVLTDGGVYDNLGLETVWKNYRTVLVSDGGGKIDSEGAPKRDWARHMYRVLGLIDNQVRALRKRQLIDSYKSKEREGTYWGIRTDLADYRIPTTLAAPAAATIALADTPTRLEAMSEKLQERLINWGYLVTDTAMRKHVDSKIAAATTLQPARTDTLVRSEWQKR